MEMTYSINDIFVGDYPPDVADFCNLRGDCYVKEIESDGGNRRFQIVAVPAPTAEEIAEQELQQKKSERADSVSRITVTVDGMTFDGDEKSQDRMARAITMFNASGLPSDYRTSWVLADSTIAQVSVSQLAQALLLAGQRQTELWIKPYES